ISRMRTTLQNIKGKADAEKVAGLMLKADNAFTSQQTVKAIEYYKEALDLQNKINVMYRDSEYYDVRIIAKAEQMLRLVSAAPFAEQIEELEKRYELETAQKHWGEAQKLLEQALQIQNKINKEFSNTSYVNYKKARELEIEINSLKAIPKISEIAEDMKAGEAFEKQGNFDLAAEKYAAAEEMQREINTIFEKSRYASDEKLREISAKKETAISAKRYKKIEADYQELQKMLRENQPYDKIVRLADSILVEHETLRKEYPLSAHKNEERTLALRYISYLGQNITKILDAINNNTIRLGKDSNAWMYKTEVDQKLYSMVMSENRSRNAGADLPVETVSIENALDFCKRLSWVSARKVDLPTKAQYMEAIGSLRYADLNALSWNASNSGMKTHKVASKEANPKGFYDLLGNVEEFARDGNTFGVIGGSSQTWTDAISDIPFSAVSKSARSDRMIGFRFVIWRD
ncbi:MAG: SUMF1/EgtB/PvdO family nonheme iron enzyme, partial [Opitutales bacterium]|nr:SUMF1/EgtB/PvdO family nonheme iron enzyme [Opitutales bacterium]